MSSAIDSEQLNDANAELLSETQYEVSTPTIYDLVGRAKWSTPATLTGSPNCSATPQG